MQRSNPVGREDEAALQDGNDEKVVVSGSGNLAGEIGISPGNGRRIEEDAYRAVTDFGH